MQVVKEGEPADLGFKHIGALQMNKTLARPAFVTTMGEPVNEQRFGHPDTFDKSTYLTTISRPKSLVPFEGFCARKPSLI